MWLKSTYVRRTNKITLFLIIEVECVCDR